MTDETAQKFQGVSDDAVKAALEKRNLIKKYEGVPNDAVQNALKARGIGAAPTAAPEGTALTPQQTERLTGKTRGTSEATIGKIRGYEKDIDYRRGAPLSAQIDFETADTPEEARAVMEKHFGKNIGQDKSGRWWYKDAQTGKKTSVQPSFLASTIASAPQTLGAIGGGAAGAAVGGPPGMIIGAGIGGSIGKGVTEFEKFLRGLNKKTVGQSAETIGKEGIVQSAVSALPVAGKPMAKEFGGFVRSKIFGVTPKSSARTGFLLEQGAIPPVVSTAKEAGGLSKKQDIARQVSYGGLFGSHGQNMQVVEGEMRKHMRNAGISDTDIDDFMQNVAMKREAPTMESGRSIVGAAQQYVSEAEGRISANLETARGALQTAESRLRARQPAPHLAQSAAMAVTEARQDFSEAMTQAYRHVHGLTNGERIVDLRPAVEEAQAIVAEAGPSVERVPPVIRRLAQGERSVPMGQPGQGEPRPREWQDFESIEASHNLRNQLRAAMRQKSLNLTPDVQYAILSRVEDHIDAAFTELSSGRSPFSPLGQEAARSLARTDNQYREGIAVFRNALVRKISNDARDGIFADPSVIARDVFRPGQTDQARRIYNMMPPPLREQLSNAYMQNILKGASEVNPFTGRNTLNGSRLLQYLNDPENARLLNVAINPSFQADMRALASEYAALNGDIEISAVNPSTIRDMLSRANAEQRSLKDFVKQNPIGRLASTNPKVVDEAVRQISVPGQEAVTLAARDNLPQHVWEQVQRDNLRMMFSDTFRKLQSDSTTVTGKALAERMAKYTPAQRAVLFPNGMGEDIMELAENIQFLFPRSYVAGGTGLQSTIASGEIQQHLLKRMPTRLMTLGIDWMVRRPGMLRWLAGQIRSSPSKEYTKAVMGATGRMIFNAMRTGPDLDSPGPEKPTPAEIPKHYKFDRLGNMLPNPDASLTGVQ
jgi:hypothetical protein